MSEQEPKNRSFWSIFTEPEESKQGVLPPELEGVTFSSELDSDELPTNGIQCHPDWVFWAMRYLPIQEASKHFFICGVTGSGKSVTIRLFLQSIAQRFRLDGGGSKYLCFSVADLLDLKKLERRLNQPARTIDTWLAARLSALTKTELSGFESIGANPTAFRAALLHDLNQVGVGPSIYDPQRFEGVTLRPATKHLLTNPPIDGDCLRLNRMLLEDAYPEELKKHKPEQLIVFDAKCEMVSEFAGLGIEPTHENVYILNPYDARAAVWNVAEAVQSPGMARSFASLLVPEERNTTAPFFADAARELVYAVLLALNNVAGDTWTFRDLLCSLDSRERIATVTAQYERAHVLAQRILSDENHSLGVLSTLATKIGPFEQVAALWHSNKTARRFTIPEFLAHPGVLILGNDPVLRQSLWPINAILLKALANEILRGVDTDRPHHWFVLDEFRAMEKVDCIHDLINLGRSKGVSVLIGLQSYEGLASVYGDLGANDILSMCAQKTFLRVGGPKTAEWAQEFFGSVRHMERSTTQSHGGESGSISETLSLQDRPMFLASYFLNLPLTGVGQPYVAVCDVPCLGETLIVQRSFDEVLSWCRPRQRDVPGILPQSNPQDQLLLPWSEGEAKRFCGSAAREATDADKDKKKARKAKLPPRHHLNY